MNQSKKLDGQRRIFGFGLRLAEELGVEVFQRRRLGGEIALQISPVDIAYITNAEAGQGLLRCGGSIVPFADRFPRGTCWPYSPSARAWIPIIP